MITFTSDNHQVDLQLSQGDIVTLKGYNGIKWIVCKGYYTYDNSRCYGWYFKSIPDNRVLPENKIDLCTVTLLSSEGGISCGCGCFVDMPNKPEINVSVDTDNCFVTVNTIAERNALGNPYPPNGKLVRVNDVKDETRYYVWNEETLHWDDLTPAFDQNTVLERLQKIEEELALLRGQTTPDNPEDGSTVPGVDEEPTE